MANPPSDIDQELEAIRALLTALSPLSPEARVNAVDYAMRRLDIQLPRRAIGGPTGASPESARPPAPPAPERPAGDIRSLKDEKRPRSAIEMAALVAYYLAEISTEDERKDTVTTDELRKYFKQAGFPLPGAIQYTLGNAAAAGFFESAGRGEYRLTAVGHNLVAHVLPASDEPAPRPKRARKVAARKPAKTSSASKKAVTKKSATKTPAAKKSGTRKAAKKR